MRMRYDTPKFRGLTAAFAFGTDVLNDRNGDIYADVALRYQRDTPDLKLGAGIGYSVSPNQTDISGSLSAVHKHSGGSFTLALGESDLMGKYTYAKLGVKRELISQGVTSFSIDYYGGNDFGSKGSNSVSMGLAVVQQVTKWNAEAFALLRWYDFDDNSTDYLGSSALFTGLRWKF